MRPRYPQAQAHSRTTLPEEMLIRMRAARRGAPHTAAATNGQAPFGRQLAGRTRQVGRILRAGRSPFGPST